MLRFLRLLRWRLPPPLTSAHRCGPIGLPRRGQRAGDLTVADQLAGIRPMASTNAPKAVQIALGVLAEEAARQSFRVPRCTRIHVSCRRTCRGDHVRLCAPGPLKASELTLQPRAPARPSRTAHGCLRPTAPRCGQRQRNFTRVWSYWREATDQRDVESVPLQRTIMVSERVWEWRDQRRVC